MAYERNDLLLHITPTRTVRRWADGALTWQVQALLERLRGLTAYAQSAADLACAAGNRP